MNSRSFSPVKGQASLEFILVLIFMLVIMGSVVAPLGQRAQFALDDVSKAGFADAGLKVIRSVVGNMTLVPGNSRQLVDVYLPPGSFFACSNKDNNVGIIFPLNSDVFDATGNAPVNCVENPDPLLTSSAMLCSKSFIFPPSATLRCQGDPLLLGSFVIQTGQVGFSQHFKLESRYDSSSSPAYIIDFNAV